jgi:Alginate export
MPQKIKLLIFSAFLTFVTQPYAQQAAAEKSFYKNPLSYSTTRDPDPPKYSRNASDTGIESLQKISWLDLGLDYRFRYEYRDDDIRRAQAGLDQPLLHRTRAYLGIKEILDPFRFAVELQDSRSSNSKYPRDNRDWNEHELIRLYGELYFDDLLGYDANSNPRPLSLRYGIHNFEFLDRRLIGNNQWRNTANTFRGFHASLGAEKTDWQLDLLAIQPLQRLSFEQDEVEKKKWLFAAIGHWRRWSDIVTLEPYYLALDQSPDGSSVERIVHSPGLRAYGTISDSCFDYDSSFTYQFGDNGTRSIQSYGGSFELGYTIAEHPWKPRISAFYGFASGDRDSNDLEDNRFERFYGFGRPWSANDSIVYENISTPKLRVEAKPNENLRFDFGYSWYWLASDKDRFIGANNARESSGKSGGFIGHEFDIRGRYTLNPKTEITIGYAHFLPGDFTENKVRPGDTDFLYLELGRRFF